MRSQFTYNILYATTPAPWKSKENFCVSLHLSCSPSPISSLHEKCFLKSCHHRFWFSACYIIFLTSFSSLSSQTHMPCFFPRKKIVLSRCREAIFVWKSLVQSSLIIIIMNLTSFFFLALSSSINNNASSALLFPFCQRNTRLLSRHLPRPFCPLLLLSFVTALDSLK